MELIKSLISKGRLFYLGVYATILATIYTWALNGPKLFGLGNFITLVVISGFCGFFGSLIIQLLNYVTDKGRKKRHALYILIWVVVSGFFAIALFIGHVSHFDGTRTAFTDNRIALYLVWNGALALMINATIESAKIGISILRK